MSDLEDLDRMTGVVAALLDQVSDDQLSRPTACAAWDVRAVVAHLDQGGVKAIAWATGGPESAEPAAESVESVGSVAPAESAGSDEAGHLRADVRAGFAAIAGRVRATFGEPGFGQRTIRTPLGPWPGTMLIASRVNELLVHGWDIADAIGQPTDLEPDLAERALDQWRAHLGDGPRPHNGPFGPEQLPPADATAADRLAAYLGRRSVRA